MAYEMNCWLNWDRPTPTMTEVAGVFARLEAQDRNGPADDSSLAPARRRWESVLGGDRPESWDNHQFDVARMSRFWPQVTFTLKCSGDGDWMEYYLDGKFQEVEPVKVVYPELDPEKMDTPAVTTETASDFGRVIYAVTVQHLVNAYDRLAEEQGLAPWDRLTPEEQDALLMAGNRACWQDVEWVEHVEQFFQAVMERTVFPSGLGK